MKIDSSSPQDVYDFCLWYYENLAMQLPKDKLRPFYEYYRLGDFVKFKTAISEHALKP